MIQYQPDFSKVPSWVKAWAVDGDRRTAIFYDRIPEVDHVGLFWNIKAPDYESIIDENFPGLDSGIDWKKTLVKRTDSILEKKVGVDVSKKELMNILLAHFKSENYSAEDLYEIVHTLIVQADRTTLESLYMKSLERKKIVKEKVAF